MPTRAGLRKSPNRENLRFTLLVEGLLDQSDDRVQ